MKYIIQYKWPYIEYVSEIHDMNSSFLIGWQCVSVRERAQIFYNLLIIRKIVKNAKLRYCNHNNDRDNMLDFKIIEL